MRARRRLGAASAALALLLALLNAPSGQSGAAHADSPGSPPAKVLGVPTFGGSGLLVVDTAQQVWLTGAQGETAVVTDLDGGDVREVQVGTGAHTMVASPDGQYVHVARGLFKGRAEIVTFRTTDLVEVSRTLLGVEHCTGDLVYAAGRLWVAYGCPDDVRGGAVAVDPFSRSAPLPAGGNFSSRPVLSTDGVPGSDRLVVTSVFQGRETYVDVADAGSSGPQLAADGRLAVLDTAGPTDAAPVPGRGLVAIALRDGVRVLRLSDGVVVRRVAEFARDIDVDRQGRHLLLTPVGGGGGMSSHSVEQDVVLHGLSNPSLSAVGWGRDGRAYGFDGRQLVLQDGWDVDPLDLRLDPLPDELAPLAAVDVRGSAQTTDGSARPVVPLQVTRSGPDGTVSLAPVVPAADGSFAFRDVPTVEGGFTYRVAYPGDSVRARVVAQVGTRLGDPPPSRVSRPPARGLTTSMELEHPDVVDLVVDDRNRRVYISSGVDTGAVSVRDLDGREVGQLAIPDAGRMSLSPDGTTLFVASLREPTVVVVDTATTAVVDRWWLGSTVERVNDISLVGDLLLWSATSFFNPDGWGRLDPGRPRRTAEVDGLPSPEFLQRPDEPGRAVLEDRRTLGAVRVDGDVLTVEERLTSFSLADERAFGGGSGPVVSLTDDLVTAGVFRQPDFDGGLTVPLRHFFPPYGRPRTTQLQEVDTTYVPEDRSQDFGAIELALTADARFAALGYERGLVRLVPFGRPGEAFWSETLADESGGAPEFTRMAFAADGSRLYTVRRDSVTFRPTATLTVFRDPLGGIGPQLPLAPRRLTVTQGQSTSRVRWVGSSDDGGSPVTGYRIETDGGDPPVTVGPDVRSVLLPDTEPMTTVSVRTLTGLGASPPRSVSPPVPPPAPGSGRAVDDACPSGEVPQDVFADVPDGDPHERGVECVAWWKVTTGRGPGAFAPTEEVRRDGMASFLARAITESGGALLDAPPDAFDDDDGSVHEKAINQLAAAGVVKGVGERAFGPKRQVTRGQMARFLAGAYEHRDQALPAGPDAFADDDDSPFEGDIDRVTAAGIAGGRGPGSYAPGASVLRNQLATFLSRWLDAVVEAGPTGVRTP